MTNLDATPRPGPESPAPGMGETLGEGAAGLATEAQLARSRRKKRILAAIGVALAIIIAILVLRACTGRAPLPGILAPKLPHYVFSIYGVDRPMGVAVSPNGDRIYVTESDGHRVVRVFDPSGHRVDTLRPPGRTGGHWHVPVYVAVAPSTGDVYVSDRVRRTVYVYDAKGAYVGRFRARGRLGRGLQPLGLAFGPGGDLYMTDVGGRRSHRVLIFGPNGKLKRKLGSRREFSFPNGVVVNSRGDVYVSDSNHGRLAIFNPAGKLAGQIRRGVADGDLGLPRGVAIDGDGRLYVVDTTAQAVKVYRTNKEAAGEPVFIGSFGQEGLGNGQFSFPNGVATDSQGRIYVTDRENNRVQVWRY